MRESVYVWVCMCGRVVNTRLVSHKVDFKGIWSTHTNTHARTTADSMVANVETLDSFADRLDDASYL